MQEHFKFINKGDFNDENSINRKSTKSIRTMLQGYVHNGIFSGQQEFAINPETDTAEADDIAGQTRTGLQKCGRSFKSSWKFMDKY